MMRKIVLLMTVGTGVGEDKDKKIERLAHGLLSSILHYHPEKIVFFGSEKSKDTIKSLKKQYKEETNEEFINHDFVLISKIDNFDECFLRIRKKVEEYEKDYEVIIDYTSGTKTMTTAASVCSILYHKKLSLISGNRGKNGIVILGTESVIEQNLYSAYDKYLFDKFKELFNFYHFTEARNTLDQIVILDEKEKFRNLVDGYELWDKFDHKSAFEKLSIVKDERVNKNKEFLGRLIREGRTEYILTDLIINAERRISEGKYDDAVARLYRAVELISQMKLKEYDLDELSDGKLTIDNLENKGLDTKKYKDLVDEKGKLKLGLKKKFELLRDLGWDLANPIYFENKNIRELLSKRNNSILAHGLEPIDRKSAVKLFSEIERIVREMIKDYKDLKDKGSFPKLL